MCVVVVHAQQPQQATTAQPKNEQYNATTYVYIHSQFIAHDDTHDIATHIAVTTKTIQTNTNLNQSEHLALLALGTQHHTEYCALYVNVQTHINSTHATHISTIAPRLSSLHDIGDWLRGRFSFSSPSPTHHNRLGPRSHQSA